jgi:large subunit ribosomal protein L24
MSISRIKTNDTVIVIAGEAAGKTGRVLRIDRVRGRAIVEGMNLVKKTFRRSQQHPDGAILEREAPIALSNLMPYDPKLKKGVRVARVREGGRSVREAKGSGHRFD